MKQFADRHRQPRQFTPNDLVLLRLSPHYFRQPSTHPGLLPRYDGPFRITERIGNAAYRLYLPPRLAIHPVFHVSLLKPFFQDPDPTRPNPPTSTPSIPTLPAKPACILARRTLNHPSRTRPQTQFLVQWLARSVDDSSWEDAQRLEAFPDLILCFLHDPTGTSGFRAPGFCHAPPRTHVPSALTTASQTALEHQQT